jgi:hypothetical protein
VLIYHSDNMFGLSAIFRATAPSLGADNFTILDQPVGNSYVVSPVDPARAPYEVEQCADIEVLRAPSGQAYAFWTAADNRTNTFRIMAAPLLPTRKMWDGYSWHNLDASEDVARGIAAATKPFVQTMSWDFTVPPPPVAGGTPSPARCGRRRAPRSTSS